MNEEIKRLSWKEFIEHYDESVIEAISKNRNKKGVSGVATLQCAVFDSSRFGQKTALIYGQSCTHKSMQEVIDSAGTSGIYVTGLPSSASFPINYTEDVPFSV